MNKNEQYDVDKAWPIEEPSNAEKCLERLVKLSHSMNKIECHGVDQNYGCIRSTLDIRFEKSNISEIDRNTKETSLLESYVKEAYFILPPDARRFIDIAKLKWETYHNTGTMFIGRHYRLPTRCIDWTRDIFIALFFACYNSPEENGIIWWMDYDVFSYAIAKQWTFFYGKMENIEDNFEKDFTENIDKDIITRFHYNCLVDRPNKQKAHIMLSGKYNVQHDRKIFDIGVRKCGRIAIRSDIKQKLLDKLSLWGINNATLSIKESPVESIVSQVADEILGKDNNKK